jgi:hypothetical protein
MRNVDVATIGAGHAGLNALKEVRAAGASWVLIDGGPLGTTCARVGCMPSKAVIELARAGRDRGVPVGRRYRPTCRTCSSGSAMCAIPSSTWCSPTPRTTWSRVGSCCAARPVFWNRTC